jgi:hypothetical protein
MDPLASIELALELEPVQFHHMQETVAPLYPDEPDLREPQEPITPEHEPKYPREPIFCSSVHTILQNGIDEDFAQVVMRHAQPPQSKVTHDPRY